MRRLHTFQAIAIASLLADIGSRQGVEMAEPQQLPPHDPNFRIKKPGNSWGRKSKKRGKK